MLLFDLLWQEAALQVHQHCDQQPHVTLVGY